MAHAKTINFPEQKLATDSMIIATAQLTRAACVIQAKNAPAVDRLAFPRPANKVNKYAPPMVNGVAVLVLSFPPLKSAKMESTTTATAVSMISVTVPTPAPMALAERAGLADLVAAVEPADLVGQPVLAGQVVLPVLLTLALATRLSPRHNRFLLCPQDVSQVPSRPSIGNFLPVQLGHV
jgi:hypothetical protein